jgi:carboxylesterase type B
VGLHLVSPASAGLFHRAIIESGTPLIRWPRYDETVSQGEALAAALGCAGDATTVRACLRIARFDLVLQALPQGAQQVTEPAGRTFWLPTVDGIEIPDQPRLLIENGAFHQVPTIVGTTRDEGWGFVTRSFDSGATLADYETWLQTGIRQ